jgi:hypothetical protein
VSVRPAPATATRAVRQARQRRFGLALHGAAPIRARCACQPRKSGRLRASVSSRRDRICGGHPRARLLRLRAAGARRAGLQQRRSAPREEQAARGTPRSIVPPLRRPGCPPRAPGLPARARHPSPRGSSHRSSQRSSTTTTGCPAARAKPRRRAITPSPLGEQAGAAEGPRHLVGHEDAAEGRGDHRHWIRPAQERRSRAARSAPRRVASAGSIRTRAHWRYRGEWSPEVSRKWPRAGRRAPGRCVGRRRPSLSLPMAPPSSSARMRHAGPLRLAAYTARRDAPSRRC